MLALKKDELNASSTTWRARVEKSDAEKFTVTGRMQDTSNTPTINISQASGEKSTPKLRRFKSKEGMTYYNYLFFCFVHNVNCILGNGSALSTPTTPDTEGGNSLKRSYSVPGSRLRLGVFERLLFVCKIIYFLFIIDPSSRPTGKKVAVIRPDDETFKRFFKSVDQHRSDQKIDISLDDLNCITRSSDCLLIQKKGIQVQKRRGATKNPVKTLASHIEIQSEYTEILTGAVERETRRLNIEKRMYFVLIMF